MFRLVHLCERIHPGGFLPIHFCQQGQHWGPVKYIKTFQINLHGARKGNRKTLITSSHICECLFLGPMLITNTKRGLSLFWGIPRKHWNTYQAPASAIPSTILTEGGKNQTLFVAFVVVIVEDLFQPEHVRKSKEAPCWLHQAQEAKTTGTTSSDQHLFTNSTEGK